MKRPSKIRIPRGPDELQREIWQYRRIWISLIIIFILGRLLLPHLRLLRGWEQKATLAVVEIGKTQIPDNATRVTSSDEAIAVFKGYMDLDPEMVSLNGPVLVAAWKCSVLSEKSACFRYLSNDQQLTLAVVDLPHNKREIHDPFTKSGWSGYLILHKKLAFIMVGSLDSDDIKTDWPFTKIVSVQTN
jgi:hypothetical protein